ncbi:hypothetical protein PO878_05710 [Iamia majanohamensis]|uniref:Uncharacterized protein n=1 Tax=Iamia majanohamensis TaxID=467976 RepID=A0AAE9Y9F3_9ACTN|nr:hypothetical protein [Iamia majanohamensis]WCO68221.1 hypothetical protein PO878_05710 [Iamia majanohamensis]
MLAIEFSSGIEDAWSDVASFVPKLLGFLVVLVLGYIVAKAIAKIADKALERVGFDRAVQKGGVGRALSSSRYDASDLIGKVTFYALFLIVLQLAFGVFGSNPVSDLIEGVIAYLPKVIAAILIIVVAAAIAAAAKEVIEASLGGLEYGRTLALIASVAILTVGAFAALDQLQIAEDIVNVLFMGLVAALAGIAIVAVGGGGIAPMRARWESALERYDEEKPRVREQAQGAKGRVQERAHQRADQARSAADGPGGASNRRR